MKASIVQDTTRNYPARGRQAFTTSCKTFHPVPLLLVSEMMSRQIRDAKKIGRVGGNRPWILTDRFGPEMAIFPTFFFLGSIGQENVFYDILERRKRLSRL